MTQPKHNKEVVLGFLRLAFTEKRPADAFAEYAGENYVQHNPTPRRAPRPRRSTSRGSWRGFPS